MRKTYALAMIGLVALLLFAHAILVQTTSVVLAQSESERLLLIHGIGDDIIQIPDLNGSLLVARVHGNPGERHFSVTTYDKFGNFVSLLVNTTESYIGIVPFDFDAYGNHDLGGGLLEVKAQGNWSIEIIDLNSLSYAQNNQVLAGYDDYVGYVKGSSLVASVYGNEALRHFSVSAIGLDEKGGHGALVVNTTSLYQGNVRLPINKEGLVFIVKATGPWVISFSTSDSNDVFDASAVSLKSNPYSPFNAGLEKPTATPASTPTPTLAPASIVISETDGTVNRSANLRAGPGTNFAIADSAKAGDKVEIVGKNADGSWLKLADDKWIAAFLVSRGQASSQPIVVTQVATKTTTISPTATVTVAPPASPQPAPAQDKPTYWGDVGIQTCGDFEWRVSDVRRSKDAWYYDKHQVAQGEYLLFYVEVKNISGGTASFWSVKPSIPGKDIAERASQYAAWMMTGGFNTLWKDDIAPGEFITLVGAFDVAPDTHTYLFGVLSCTQIVAVGSWFELERGAIKASN